jgi:serine/threonine-protein kinase
MPDLIRDAEFGTALVDLGLCPAERVREGLGRVSAGRAGSLEEALLGMGAITPAEAARAYKRMKEKGAAPPPPPSAPSAVPGLPQIPGFQMLNEIGAGSLGTVYRARQLSFDRIVAIKILQLKLAEKREYVERFIREAKAAARVAHPNLVAAIDVMEHQGRPFVVMEYIEGTTGVRLMRNEQLEDEGQVVDIATQAAEALHGAHRAGLIHRNICPEKMLFQKDGTLKLADLGLAREEKSLIGDFAVSPKYIPPEVVKGERKLDIRSDLYSLGCTLYHMLTGSVPYPLSSPPAMAQAHVNEPVPTVKSKRPGVSDRFNAVVYKLMQKRPDDRYQTPGELLNDLRTLQARRKPVEVMPAPPPPPPPAPAPAAPGPSRGSAQRYAQSRSGGGGLIAVLLLVGCAGIGVYVFRDKIFSKAEPPPVGPNGGSVKPPNPDAAARALAELDEIGVFASRDAGFQRIEEVLLKFRSFIDRHKGLEGKALEKREEYVKRADAAARAELNRLDAEQQPLRGQGRWRDVLHVYEKFPRRFLDTTSAGEEAKQRVATVIQNASEQYAQDKGKVEALVRSRKFSDALNEIQFMIEVSALDMHLPELEKRKEEIVRLREAGETAMEREIRDLLLRIDAPFRDKMTSRAYDDALALMRDFLFGPWTAKQLELIRAAGVDYDALEKASAKGAVDWPKIERVAGAGAGDPMTPATASPAQRILLDLRNVASLAIFRQQIEAGLELAMKGKDREKFELASYPGERCFFERRSGKAVMIIDGKRSIDLDFYEVVKEPVDHLQIAGRSLDPDYGRAKSKAATDATFLLRGALYHYYWPAGNRSDEPYLKSTADLFRQAIEAGARGARLYQANLLAIMGAQREAQLKGDFERAMKLMTERKWVEARKVFEALAGEKSSAFAQSKGIEIQSHLAAIHERLREEKNHAEVYRGAVETLDGGRLKVTYDFNTKEQLEAFEVLALDARNRWSLTLGALGSSGDKCAVRWRTPVKGDVELEYDLTPVDPPQNVAVNLYWNAAAANRHYSVVFGFDIITGKEDPQDAAEERFQMPRTCILRYPTGFAPNDPEWVKAGTWKRLYDALVGKATGEWKLAKNRKDRVRIARVGKKVTLAVGTTSLWEGEDETYGEGSILFYADSRVRIDNLSITFKP